MPPRTQKILFCLILVTVAWMGHLAAYDPPASPAPRSFHYDSDTFSFANETVWNYVDGTVKTDTAERKREYTRHCFVLTRAAVQFWKFARFDPQAPELSPDQLASRIRQVTERSVWLAPLPPRQRIVIPGFRNLKAASAAHPSAFQANIGLGWPVYFRAGNMPIVLPVARGTEAALNREVLQDLAENYPTIVWLYNFPSLNINHVVVIFSSHADGPHLHYQVYDPNYADSPKHLDYDATTSSFSYQPTFFFKGGPVTVRAVYRGVIQ